MKRFIFLKPIFIVILIALLGSNCKKDDNLYTGKLQVTFANHPYGLSVNILPIDNSNIAVFTDLSPDGDGVLVQVLNIGNYIIAPTSQSSYYGTAGFQIQAGKTTKISFDQGNVAHLH